MNSAIQPSGVVSVIALALMIMLTSACSSSSNDDPTAPDTNPIDDVPVAPETPAIPSEPEAPSEPITPTEPEAPSEPITPTEPEVPSEPITPTEPEVPSEPIAPTEPEVPSEPITPTEPDAPSEPTTPLDPEDPIVLVPPVDANSALGRLLDGIHRQVEATLLDLNQRLSSGILLTDQQNQCLGSFDPGVGESLTMINCEQPLATDDIAIFVERASFFNTSACQEDLFNGRGNNCTVMQARITLPTTFEVTEDNEGGDIFVPQRPQPVAGAEIFFAIEGTQLRVENNPSSLTGVFRCDYDLETGLADGNSPISSCDEIISSIADRFDTLRPPALDDTL